jgi:hypothetical protein
MANLGKALGAKNGLSMGFCPTLCSWPECPGLGLICIQAATLAGEAGLAPHSEESGKNSRRGVSMNGNTLLRQDWGRVGRVWGELAEGFMPCICLFVISIWETT